MTILKPITVSPMVKAANARADAGASRAAGLVQALVPQLVPQRRAECVRSESDKLPPEPRGRVNERAAPPGRTPQAVDVGVCIALLTGFRSVYAQCVGQGRALEHARCIRKLCIPRGLSE